MKGQVGVIGLAVMGKNLALNIAEHGFLVSVFNRSQQRTDELLKEVQREEFNQNVIPTKSIEEFIHSLERPRKIILMIKAGEAVDQTIQELMPHLEPGDLLMDGGNSYFMDTIRRSSLLEEKGILYLGTGISGGEEGARKGPAIMPGGKPEAYEYMKLILTEISAKAEGESCCKYVGENGAGHFVKMVHNGIEYADMQLICEAYQILKNICGLTPPELKEVFADWGAGELDSYLIDITADIFGKKDDRSDGYLVDHILDTAGQKGTGKWTGQISLDFGVPTPTITAAVYERFISARKAERVKASESLDGPAVMQENSAEFIEAVRRALYSSKICAYAQGFSLMKAAAEELGWNLNYSDIAKIFRGGCIIRAQFLNKISHAFQEYPDLPNLLLEDYFRGIISTYQADWRKVIATAIQSGVSIPAFSSSLAYYDSYRAKNLPMNLLQAQRDYFGAHTYQRTDVQGIFHTEW